MNILSEATKKELCNVLKGRRAGVFVIDGKLISFEVENKKYRARNLTY